MALIMYFTRAPRYKNITIKDIKMMESYFRWQYEKAIGSRYGNGTFENWCGHSESELPETEVIDYYKHFFTKKTIHIEGIGKQESNSVVEQLARLVKTNHIFNWFIKNVMDNVINQEYYEVTKEQLESFLQTCYKVKDTFNNEHSVDENVAKELLPLMDEAGYFFGPNTYSEFYTDSVVKVIEIVDNILKTTDFEKQTIYFNATW